MIRLITLMDELRRRRQIVLPAPLTSDKSKPSSQRSRERSKFLNRVLTEALHDHDFAVVLIDSVARLASDDPRLTQQLRDSLKASRRGARGTPYWLDLMLVRDYQAYRRVNNATFEEALDPLASDYHVSPETMRGKLARALRRVPPEAAQLWR